MSLVITQGYGDSSGSFAVVSVTPYVNRLEIEFDQNITLVGMALTATNWVFSGGSVAITASSVSVSTTTVTIYHNEALNGESLSIAMPYAGIFYGTEPYSGPLGYGFTSVGVSPTISNAAAVSAYDIRVRFSEAVDSTQATDAGNWTISGGFTVQSVAQEASDIYLVTINGPMAASTVYSIEASGIEDLAGNVA